MPATFKVIFRSEKFQQKLTKLAAEFTPRMRIAARNIMREFVSDIIEGTPKPGDSSEGFNREYVRTGRLVGGWSPAAASLSLPVDFSGGEGAFWEIVNDDEISLFARNDVPYASAVEHIGPWLIPPNASGGPTFRGGRHMVENARNNIVGSGIIQQKLSDAWRILIK